MAHTDRDDENVFWRKIHTLECPVWRAGWRSPVACAECDFQKPERLKGMPIEDSQWRRDERRYERGRARMLMRRARSGHIDWDELVIAYRRPYYW